MKMSNKVNRDTVVNALIERFNMYMTLAEENPEYKIEWLSYAEEIVTVAMYQDLLTPEQFTYITDGLRELKFSN